MHYKTILALTDLSVTGNQAVHRAAMLAAQRGAELQLMYLPSHAHPHCLHHAAHLEGLARSLARSAGIAVQAMASHGASLRAIAAQAQGADLLVLAYRRGCSITGFFRGETYQRLMRAAPCPLLLTRLDGRLPYAKIMVAVAFNGHARQLIQLACEVDGHAQLGLFHAIARADEAKLRSADVPWAVVQAFRNKQLLDAQQRLANLAQSIDTGGRSLASTVARWGAGRQGLVPPSDGSAALTVVGKQRRGALWDFFCGSVSQRVLASTASDVLIVPHGYQPASRVAAKRRITAEPAAG